MNRDLDGRSLLWFKTITFDIQDLSLKNNAFEDYMNLHKAKTMVYSISDGELTKEIIIKALEENFQNTTNNDIRQYIRNIQLEYLVG